MQRTCIRCMTTSARSFLPSQASTSSSSSSISNHPQLQGRPVIPELNHVDPELRELLRRPLQYAAVYYGNDPDEVFNDRPSSRSSSSSRNSTSSTATSFAKVAQDVTRNNNFSSPSSSSSSSSASSFASALSTPEPPQKVEKTIEIPLLEDPLITFLTNLMMKDGKKARARNHVSTLLSTLRQRSSALPMAQLREAIRLAAPSIRLTQQKRGGKQVAVPIALGERQRVHKAIDWILDASDKRKNPNAGGSKVFGERVALEIEAVLNGTSEVLKKKEQLHATGTVSRANVNAGSKR